MPHRTLLFIIVLLSFIGSSVSEVSGQENTEFRHDNTPDNLKMLFELIFQKVEVERSLEDAAALFRSTLPDEERTRRGLRDGLPSELLDLIIEFQATVFSNIDAEAID